MKADHNETVNLMGRLSRAANQLLGRPSEPENFILSYPKIGRTWLRVSLATLISEKHGIPLDDVLDIDSARQVGPRFPRFHHDFCNCRNRWNELPTEKQEFSNTRVIFLVRDIRNVLVSYYFHWHKERVSSPGRFRNLFATTFGARKNCCFFTRLGNKVGMCQRISY